MMLENWEGAINDLQKVVQAQPFSVDIRQIRQDLSRALSQCGRNDEANEGKK